MTGKFQTAADFFYKQLMRKHCFSMFILLASFASVANFAARKVEILWASLKHPAEAQAGS